METVTTRLSEEDVTLIDRLVELRGGTRPEIVRTAVRTCIREELLDIGLERYRNREVGLRGAAELAGLTISETMAAANERTVYSNETVRELERDVQALR
ncbi:MAG: hypothetical protein ABEI77_02330 [Halorientalis sp.]